MRPSRETMRRYLLFLALLCSVFWLATVFQVSWLFELGTYDQYTASILEDGDFNLINQKQNGPMGWMVTPTGNDADMTLPGVAAYLAPFFAYRYAQELAGAPKDAGFTRFMDVHVLSTVFYVLCAMLVLWRILARFRVPHFRKAVALAALSTPFAWHFLFASTNNNIFGLAYSIFAFAYYALLREKKEIPAGQLAVLGLSLGLGLTIRQQLFWIALLPVALLLEGRRLKARDLAAFALGAALPLMLMAADNFVRYGTAKVLFMEASNTSYWNLSPALLWASFRYVLFGPNGYLFISPIYLFAAIALASGALKSDPFGRASWLAVVAPVCILASQGATGLLPDTLGGRHFLEYYFLLVLILAGALRALERRSARALRAGVAICAALAAWNLLVTFSFYYRDRNEPWLWYLASQVSPANAARGIGLLLGQLAPDRLLGSAGSVLSLLPLLLPLALALQALHRMPFPRLARALAGFFVLGAAIFAIFTLVNVTHHGRNVAELRRQGFYDQKVVGRSGISFLYDGGVEGFRLSGAYYASNGRCDLASEISRRFRGFLDRVQGDIETDPIGFASDLGKGVVRPSAYEDPAEVRELDRLLLANCSLSFSRLPNP